MRLYKLTLFLLVLIIIFIVSFFSIDSLKVLTGKILQLNSPLFSKEEFAGRHYRLYRPNQGNPTNTTQKKYPLIIYLHGAGERGNDNRRQSYGLSFLGNGFGKQAQLFRIHYPCFVYIPQCPKNKTWDDYTTLETIIKTAENTISQHPIDRDRLYLIGYSMGGSGTYSLAGQYYKFNKQLFAGIIRLAGQGSFPDSTHKIIAMSSIWLHVGLKDTALRVSKAQEAFDRLKVLHNENTEKYKKSPILNHPGMTTTLGISDRCLSVKKTDYEQDGHSISHVPFKEPSLMEWLFKQKICHQTTSS